VAANLYQAVLAALLQKSVWMGVRHVATDGVFTETTVRLLLAQIDHLHGRILERDLDCDDLQLACEASHSGQLATDLTAYIAAMRVVRPADQTIVRELLARELLTQAAGKIIDAQNLGRLDIDGPAVLISRAQEICDGGAAAPNLTLGTAIEPAGTERGLVLSLGLGNALDEALGGGSGEGELTVYFGPPRRGKTSALCKTAANMVKDGYNVLYITMETGAPQIMRLIERAMMRKSRKDWTDADTSEARRLLGARGGRLWIKDLAAMEVTPDSLEGIVRGLQRSEACVVHAVVLDYLELMAPSRGRLGDNQIRYLYGRLGKQVRGLGRKLGTRIITAWQANREGSQRDTMTEVDISECWDMFKHADNWIALNQSSAEKANHRMRFGILKQRVDPDGAQTVNAYCDWARMIVEDPIHAVHHTPTAEPDTAGIVPGVARRPSLPSNAAVPGLSAAAGDVV
jgi:hypothetical protein